MVRDTGSHFDVPKGGGVIHDPQTRDDRYVRTTSGGGRGCGSGGSSRAASCLVFVCCSFVALKVLRYDGGGAPTPPSIHSYTHPTTHTRIPLEVDEHGVEGEGERGAHLEPGGGEFPGPPQLVLVRHREVLAQGRRYPPRWGQHESLGGLEERGADVREHDVVVVPEAV